MNHISRISTDAPRWINHTHLAFLFSSDLFKGENVCAGFLALIYLDFEFQALSQSLIALISVDERVLQKEAWCQQIRVALTLSISLALNFMPCLLLKFFIGFMTSKRHLFNNLLFSKFGVPECKTLLALTNLRVRIIAWE
jgi:hypothetical protein